MHLFQCWSIQESIGRFWPFLRLNDGVLAMDGYVELNLAMQKALAEEFLLERAVDSAMGDWSEDVQLGQEAMTEEDFAMFLFELCTLWCGPNVSVHVYLLFLCAVFIAVTDHSGAFTLGLRRLEDVERLPETFFELLNLQGPLGRFWQASLASWLHDNVATEAQQAAVQHVQRQVFQLTHDARSVFLFQLEDLLSEPMDRWTGPPKPGTQKPQVFPPQVPGANHHGSGLSDAQLTQLGLCGKSVLSRPPEPRPQVLPIGRLFDTELVQYQGRGLGLAGQSAILAARPNVRSIITASSVATADGLPGWTDSGAASNSHSSLSNPMWSLLMLQSFAVAFDAPGYSMPSAPTTSGPSKPPTATVLESSEAGSQVFANG
ncbi:unnamed protein product [Durusdinium trenchii]|uniref:Uncharacterized protein n=1 Tax=Durusdinium trenchii TaxID=1381693 RepID=A0ABP0M7S8_9DINO